MNRDKDREAMHRMLDGDASPEEQKVLNERIEADPALKEEFIKLAGAVRMMKESKRPVPPPFFTAEVMGKLPRRGPSLVQRFRDLFSDSRVLRWNMSTAAATAGMVVIAIIVVVLLQREPQEEPTITVKMSYSSPKAQSVAVAGNFNKWSADTHRMRKQSNGIWTIAIPLRAGTYTYQFVVDGRTWIVDPRAGIMQDDGFGSRNGIVRVNI